MKHGILFFLLFFLSVRMAIAQKSAVDTTESNVLFSSSIYYYSFKGESDNIIPIVYADYKSMHFEARYNYEDKNTASVFGGYRFEAGNKLEAGITPMAGLVFGNTNAFSPGLEIDLTFLKFDFYSESEWLIDFESRENNYLYTWTELAFNPNDNIRTGLSSNRTKVYQSEREIQHGVFMEYSIKRLTAGLHYFNPLADDYFFVASLSFEFN